MNQMQSDWEARAQDNAFEAIWGNSLSEKEFWETGYQQVTQYIYPYLPQLIGDSKGKTLLELGSARGRLLRPLTPLSAVRP